LSYRLVMNRLAEEMGKFKKLGAASFQAHFSGDNL